MQFKNNNSPITFDNMRSQIVITSNKIQNLYNKVPGMLLVFRDTCGYCVKFKPEFTKLFFFVEKWNAYQRNLESDSTERQRKSRILFINPLVLFFKFRILLIFQKVIRAIDITDPNNSSFIEEHREVTIFNISF